MCSVKDKRKSIHFARFTDILALKEHKSTCTTQHVGFLRHKMERKKNTSEENLERHRFCFFRTDIFSKISVL